MDLQTVKVSNLFEMAECAIANQLDHFKGEESLLEDHSKVWHPTSPLQGGGA